MAQGPRHFTVTALFLDDGLPVLAGVDDMLRLIASDIAHYDAGWFGDDELAHRMLNHEDALRQRGTRRQSESCFILAARCGVAASMLNAVYGTVEAQS